MKAGVYSETGQLEGVILHTPGPEVENMTPVNAERALYSDILNLSVARREYAQLEAILRRYARTYQVSELLAGVLEQSSVREDLVRRICRNESVPGLVSHLLNMDPAGLSTRLIEGVPMKKDTLTRFLSEESYDLPPLHNFFFTRDAAICLHDQVLISKMASRVRDREALIMEAIFKHHPELKTQTINPLECNYCEPGMHIEGGDVLVAREDIILAGIGPRTTPEGVDFILDRMKEQPESRHVIVQELPYTPESFIHLDMAFTLLSEDQCMIYEPLIIKPNKYRTVHIRIEGGEVVEIRNVKNIPDILSELGMTLDPIPCGGYSDQLAQEREQWHSGTNFIALAPGRLIAYERNVHTLEAMHQKGYEILMSKDVISGRVDPEQYLRYVITIEGSELARGGGGPRCMTLPLRRKG